MRSPGARGDQEDSLSPGAGGGGAPEGLDGAGASVVPETGVTSSGAWVATDLAAQVVEMLVGAKKTIAAAESLTGGALTARIVDVPGASAVLRGGVVAYATELKALLLGVDLELLARRGAVDPDVALAMAAGVRSLLGADVGVATTGVAGPTAQDGVSPGTVFVAVDDGAGCRQVRRIDVPGSREVVRAESVTAALLLVLESSHREPRPV